MAYFEDIPRTSSPGRVHSRAFSFACLLGACLSAAWAGVSIQGLQLVDIFLLLGFGGWLLSFCASRSQLYIPAGFIAVSFAVLIVLTLHSLFPLDAGYVANRFTLQTWSMRGEPQASGSSVAFRWIVALLALPLLAFYAIQGTKMRLQWAMMAVSLGASLSALIALLDAVGITQVGNALTGYVNASFRESGLSNHPNTLGISCALAFPMATYLLKDYPRRSTALVLGCFLGVALSGSRGAQVATLLQLLALFGSSQYVRTAIVRRIAPLLLIALIPILSLPGLLQARTSLFRYGENSSAEDSDAGRLALLQQGFRDFGQRPLDGAGLAYINSAHSVPVQIAASGGVILAAAMAYFFIWNLRSIRRVLGADHSLGLALGCSFLTWVAIGMVENQLTDRYLYLSSAFLTVAAAFSKTIPSQVPGSNATLRKRGTERIEG